MKSTISKQDDLALRRAAKRTLKLLKLLRKKYPYNCNSDEPLRWPYAKTVDILWKVEDKIYSELL
jgi:hypothetical protein